MRRIAWVDALLCLLLLYFYLPAREGSHRLLEFRGVSELRVQIQTTRVWSV